MAISQVDMSKALNSPNFAQQVIKSGKLSEDQRQKLVGKYGEGQIQTWEKDTTVYEIDDSNNKVQTSNDKEKTSSSKKRGVERAKEATGYNGKSDDAASVTGSAVAATGAAMSVMMGVVTGLTMILKSLKNYISNPYTSAAIGTVLLANAITLKSMDPNKEAAEALDTLAQDELPEMQEEVKDSEEQLIKDGKEIEEMLKEADENKQKGAEDVAKKKALFDANKSTVEDFNNKDKKDVTESEKSSAQTSRTQMDELSKGIDDTIAATTEQNGKIFSDIEEKEEDYNLTQDNIDIANGEIDYATSFDEATRENAKMLKTTSRLAGIGSVGVVASGVQAIATAGLNVGQYIAGGVAVATGGASMAMYNSIANEQSGYENSAKAEIDVRNELIDTTDIATETFDAEIENYEGSLELGEEMAEPIESPDAEIVELNQGNMAPEEAEVENENNIKEPDAAEDDKTPKADNKENNNNQDFNSPFIDKDEEFELF